MDSHHQEQFDAWVPGAVVVAEEEPVVSSYSHFHSPLRMPSL